MKCPCCVLRCANRLVNRRSQISFAECKFILPRLLTMGFAARKPCSYQGEFDHMARKVHRTKARYQVVRTFDYLTAGREYDFEWCPEKRNCYVDVRRTDGSG